MRDGVRTVSGGHGFAGIGRMTMLLLLQDRAASLGVRMNFEHNIPSLADLGEADAEYLRKVVKAQRGFEVAGRVMFYLPPLWPDVRERARREGLLVLPPHPVEQSF